MTELERSLAIALESLCIRVWGEELLRLDDAFCAALARRTLGKLGGCWGAWTSFCIRVA